MIYNVIFYDPSEFQNLPCRIAGQVPRGSGPGDLDLDAHIPRAAQRGMSLATCYALVAAKEALEQAQWKPATEEDKHRTGKSFFNTLRARQDGHHFPDDILKWIFVNENLILIKISLKFVLRGQINNIPELHPCIACKNFGIWASENFLICGSLTQFKSNSVKIFIFTHSYLICLMNVVWLYFIAGFIRWMYIWVCPYIPGVCVGMGMVGLEDIVSTGKALAERGYNRVNPHFVPRILVNMAAGHISLQHGLKASTVLLDGLVQDINPVHLSHECIIIIRRAQC